MYKSVFSNQNFLRLLLLKDYYYQEYSYEVQSSVSNKLKEVLKDVIHVAGLAYFEKFVYDSINTTNTAVTSTLTII